jgi:adenine/guanine phosphoribosyltransferase-like PRPP-binding protein
VDRITPLAFETEYAAALRVDAAVREFTRVLIVDDICHDGSTLSAALAAIRSVNGQLTAVAASAGQIAIPATIRDLRSLLE